MEIGRRNPHVPRFPDTSPATCVQAFVDEAFGYSRPGGEVGGPLPLPVQVCVCAREFLVFFCRTLGTLQDEVSRGRFALPPLMLFSFWHYCLLKVIEIKCPQKFT